MGLSLVVQKTNVKGDLIIKKINNFFNNVTNKKKIKRKPGQLKKM
jgi:hypothetical protein